MLSRAQIWTVLVALASAATPIAAAHSATTFTGAQGFSTGSPAPLIGSQFPGVGTAVGVPRGLGVVTGRVGSLGTVATPGGGQGLLMSNPNGTSTFTGPNGSIEAGPSPR